MAAHHVYSSLSQALAATIAAIDLVLRPFAVLACRPAGSGITVSDAYSHETKKCHSLGPSAVATQEDAESPAARNSHQYSNSVAINVLTWQANAIRQRDNTTQYNTARDVVYLGLPGLLNPQDGGGLGKGVLMWQRETGGITG